MRTFYVGEWCWHMGRNGRWDAWGALDMGFFGAGWMLVEEAERDEG